MMELLSPAGGREALLAAIRNGADAVYLGGQVLNARRGAGNFDADALIWAAQHCHERGRKVYVTVNTLLKQDELPLLKQVAQQLTAAGVDAAIVQDMGVAESLRQMAPDLPLFASTQMAVHSCHGVRFLKQAGFERAVLAREMRYEEIKACAQEGLELEIFCHGALCISCSGQCLFSSLVGGRSGNRGMCAQPCRLPYELRGELLNAQGYLLSPRDLMLIGQLDRLKAAGAGSIKIEGRLKRPEYVAIVTRLYRAAIDGDIVPGEREFGQLKQIFNRGGFTQGYAPSLVDQTLMFDERPNHMGVQVGQVRRGQVQFDCEIDPRDQIVVRQGATEPALLREDQPYHAGTHLADGMRLFRLADDRQLREARASYEGAEKPSIPISGRLTVRVGQPMTLRVSDGQIEIHVQSTSSVARAENKPLDEQRVRSQMEKTGGTPYWFEELTLDCEGDAFAPASALNELRRDALSQLAQRRIEDRRGCTDRVHALKEPILQGSTDQSSPILSVQVSDLGRLNQLAEMGAEQMIFAPSELVHIESAQLPEGMKITLALPTVCTDHDLLALHQFASKHVDQIEGVLISNPAQLALDWPGALHADYMLNIANNHALAFYQGRGITKYTPSVELTTKEIAQLGGDRALIVYGRLPLMQLRHCPLNARLGSAKHVDCHRCDAGECHIAQHELIDRKGVHFPFRRQTTSEGCILQLLNSVPMMLIRHTSKLPKASCWRLIWDDETHLTMRRLIDAFRAARDGQAPELADLPSQTTTGHYFRGVE